MQIEDLDLTVRTKTVLKHLNIDTLEQLRGASLPKVGEMVYYNFLAHTSLYFTSKVNEEIQQFLK